MTIYGYARVSSRGQDYETQLEQLEEAGCTIIYKEKITGTKKERPELDKLLNVIKKGDTVICTKLDRIARSAKIGLEIVDIIISKGGKVDILNMGKFDNTSGGKMLRTILLAFAEFERDMIVDRTAEGRARAKAENPYYHEGGKLPTLEQVESALYQIAQGTPVATVAKSIGKSRRTLYRWLKQYRTEESRAKLPRA